MKSNSPEETSTSVATSAAILADTEVISAETIIIEESKAEDAAGATDDEEGSYWVAIGDKTRLVTVPTKGRTVGDLIAVCNAELEKREVGMKVLALTRSFFVLLDGAYLCVDDHLDDDYTGCEGYEEGDRLFVAVTQEWTAAKYKEAPELVARMKAPGYWEASALLLTEERAQ